VIVLGEGPALQRTLASVSRARCIAVSEVRVRCAPEWYIDLLPVHSGDAVLLRAGTEVFSDWLDRLQAHARADGRTGTVTPFSNRGPLAGYPHPDGARPEDGTIDWFALDRWAARANRGKSLPLATAGDCCVYLREEFITALIHSPASGSATHRDANRRGAAAYGHRLAADVCVHHTGGGTPLPAAVLHPGSPRAQQAAQLCCRKTDAAGSFRCRLDLSRLGPDAPSMLLITHPGGGGTERHICDMADALEASQVRVLILRPGGARGLRLERLAGFRRFAATPNLYFDPVAEGSTLVTALRELDVRHIHVHHLLDHWPQFDVVRLAQWLGVHYDWTIHDYHLVCPRIHLCGPDGRYCGEPEAHSCNNCLAQHGDARGQRSGTEIGNWRRRGKRLLAGARKVFVPNGDVARRLAQYFPGVVYTERPHFERPALDRPLGVPYRSGESLRVALIGTMALHKGAEVVLGCARDARQRGLPIEFRLVGHAIHLANELAEAGVQSTGEYQEDQVFDLLAAQACHCALFLSILPETYCYTLSIAQAGGLYQVGFDIGAIGARIRLGRWGEVVPLGTEPQRLNDRLLQLRDFLAHTQPPAPPRFASYPDLLRDYYDLEDLFRPKESRRCHARRPLARVAA
jgi:glycosyltransferase involved in cell wall biosynthesis